MDIQTKNETLQILTQESYLLSRKARREIEMTGDETVVCPKCGTKPTILKTSNGERITVRCKCGLIGDGEIYF